ncbi:MAG: S8 family serine peptidase [Chloroflexota bacterium]|nr:S8 family serine peptidase [Chloroflexota bacterium]
MVAVPTLAQLPAVSVAEATAEGTVSSVEVNRAVTSGETQVIAVDEPQARAVEPVPAAPQSAAIAAALQHLPQGVSLSPVDRDSSVPVASSSELIAAAVPSGRQDLAVANSPGSTATPTFPPPALQDSYYQALLTRVRTAGRLNVIVALDVGSFAPEGTLSLQAASSQRAAIQRQGQLLLSSLAGQNVQLIAQYTIVPYMAFTVDEAALLALLNSSLVLGVEEDYILEPQLAQSTDIIEADVSWSSGYTGAGQTVAVIDTGVDHNHPFFGGRIVAEACFSINSFDGAQTSHCNNGQTTQTGVGAAQPLNCSGCDHGTHVAGIAMGSGATFNGVAPGANLIAIKASYTENGYPNGSYPAFAMSSILSGLQWLYGLRDQYDIAAVNLSLGMSSTGYWDGYDRSCDTFASSVYGGNPQTSMKTIVDTLRSANIATIISSGNDGEAWQISFPACISTAIAVGATTQTDTVASFSNNAQVLDLLAPGVAINSAVVGGGFAAKSGTSMAAPHVTGAWALLSQCSPSASLDMLEATLENSGLTIPDTRYMNPPSKPRIRVDVALTTLGCITATPGFQPTSTPTATRIPRAPYLLNLIPGKIEAEYFDYGENNESYRDLTPGNIFGLRYRQELDVDIKGYAQGYAVGQFERGEWLEYSIQVSTSANYCLAIRGGTAETGEPRIIRLLVNGVDVSGDIIMAQINDWENPATFVVPNRINLSSGSHVMRLEVVRGFVDVDWLQFSPDCTELFTPTPIPRRPFGGVDTVIPTRVQAENFDEGPNGFVYSDLTSGNIFGTNYRTTGLDADIKQLGSDWLIGHFQTGEWLEYSLGVAMPGSRYALTARGGTAQTDAPRQIRLLVNGVDVSGPVTVPVIPNWDSPTLFTLPDVVINNRRILVRVEVLSGFVDLDWIEFTRIEPGTGTPSATPTMTLTYTATPTVTATFTVTPTVTVLPTATSTATATGTATVLPSATSTATATATATLTHTATVTATATPTLTATPAPTQMPTTTLASPSDGRVLPSSTPVPQPGVLQGWIVVAGVTPPSAQLAGPVSVILFRVASLDSYMFTPSSDDWGSYTISGLPVGTYSIMVKRNGMVTNGIVTISSGATTVFNPGVMAAADADGSGTVDVNDLLLMGQMGINADVNADGVVNEIDLMLIGQ